MIADRCPEESSSVQPLETSERTLTTDTPFQEVVHAPDAKLRSVIIAAFRGSRDPWAQRRAERLQACHRVPAIMEGPDGLPALCRARCRDRVCPTCARRRGREAAERIGRLATRWNSCRFYTFTQPDRPGESLRDAIRRLLVSWRKLRSMDAWKVHVAGGVYCLEVTRNREKGSWHPHLHVIADGEFWSQASCVNAWRQAQGLGPDAPCFVWIKAVPDRRRTAKYVAEYAAKPVDGVRWSPAELIEYAHVLKGQRMLHTFGTAHGKSIDPKPEKRKYAHVIEVCELRIRAEAGDTDAAAAMELLLMAGRWWGLAAMQCRSAGEHHEPVDAADGFELLRLCRVVKARYAAPPPPPAADSPPTPAARRRMEQLTVWPAAVTVDVPL